MWQAPNQRGKALANQRKRDRERMRQNFHLRRVRAQIKISEPMAPATSTHARLILNDLSPKGMGMFSEAPLMVGQIVAITIEEPRRFYVHGRIVWCQEYDANSHVLSETSFSYRVGVEFVFETKEEEKSVREYCENLVQEYVYGRKAA